MDKVSREDMAVIQAYHAKSEAALANARAVVAETKTAELEYRNQILRVFIKYNMTLEDEFNPDTGDITRKVKENVGEESKQEVEASPAKES
jgi:hypothetical protein